MGIVMLRINKCDKRDEHKNVNPYIKAIKNKKRFAKVNVKLQQKGIQIKGVAITDRTNRASTPTMNVELQVNTPLIRPNYLKIGQEIAQKTQIRDAILKLE